MAKICKKCRRSPSLPKLIRCDRNGFGGEFINETDLVVYLSVEVIGLVAKTVVKSWRFWLGLLLAALALCGFLVVYMNTWIIPRMEKQILNFQTDEIQKLTARFETALVEMETKTSNRLVIIDTYLKNESQAVSNRINLEYQDSRIKQTFSDTASNYTNTAMDREIPPQVVAQFTNNLTTLKSQAETNYADLKEASDIGILIVKALTDDRRAFDELCNINTNGPIKYRYLTYQVTNTVVSKIAYESRTRNLLINIWTGTKNSASTAGIYEYAEQYSTLLLNNFERMYLVYKL
jgi:hypothetical protein